VALDILAADERPRPHARALQQKTEFDVVQDR
jgi:hypothetical protein